MFRAKFAVTLHTSQIVKQLVKHRNSSGLVRKVQDFCPKNVRRKEFKALANPLRNYSRESISEIKNKVCPPKPTITKCEKHVGPCRCLPRNAAEAYRASFAKIKRDALKLQVKTKTASRDTMELMKRQIAESEKAEETRITQILNDIDKKADEIYEINKDCGMRRKMMVQDFCQTTMGKFKDWKRGNEAGPQCLQVRLTAMECQIKEKTNTAINSVRTCIGCTTTWSLNECVDATNKEADCIIKSSEKFLENEMAKIEKLKSEILKENSTAIQQLMKSVEVEVCEIKSQLKKDLKNLIKEKRKRKWTPRFVKNS